MKGNWINYFLFFITLFVVSCANIVTPTGGLKDVLPPKVTQTNPKNHQINFSGRSISIAFDEFIKLNDAYSQVVVSPYLKNQPDLKIHGKAIIVKFLDTLAENTTYTVSFGNAISDITEGNILKGYDFSFSTGNDFDSLQIHGTVENAYTLKPEAGVYVMLYKVYSDSVPLLEKPFYISKTNESGLFELKNIKLQKYKIFALRDADADLLFGMPNEEIAFVDSLVNPEESDTSKVDSLRKTNAVKLFLFKELPAKQKLLKSMSAGYGKAVFIFRLPVQQLNIKSLQPFSENENFLKEFSKNKDTLTLWLKNYEKDSLILEFKDQDNAPDTASIALVKKNADKARGKGEEAAKVVKLSTNINAGGFDFYKTFNIQASAPIEKNNTSKIFLVEEKDTVFPTFQFSDSIHRNLSLNYKWKEDISYKLTILPGAFTDIFGNPNDTLKQIFRTTKTENYSNIAIQFSAGNNHCTYLVQLLNDKDNLLGEYSTEMSANIEFKNVSPGSYKVRVICDANNNDKWDTGNYLKKIQPEKVFYYPALITVRSNWDQQIEWNIQSK